jgi:MATE family multidrug resistance protein
MSVQWVLDVGAWFVFLAVLIQGMGKAALAASNIGVNYMHIAFMPAIGLGTALCTAVGHAIGEGRPELAVRRARIAMVMNVVYMGIVGIGVFYLLRYPLMRFMTSDVAVIEAGAGVLTWAAVFQIFDALCITYIFALRGAGDTRWPAVVTALHCWIIFIGGGYLVTYVWPTIGYHGPWMTCTLYITMLGVLLWWRFAREGWRKIDLFKRQDALAAAGAAQGRGVEGSALNAAAVEGAGLIPGAAMPAVETAEVAR